MITVLLEGSKVVATYDGDTKPNGFIEVTANMPKLETKEGYYPELHYDVDKEAFYYEYKEMPNQQDSYISYEVLVNELIRKKYSLSQELAILRQKDVKVTEYKEYYAYCEECKSKAKKNWVYS